MGNSVKILAEVQADNIHWSPLLSWHSRRLDWSSMVCHWYIRTTTPYNLFFLLCITLDQESQTVQYMHKTMSLNSFQIPFFLSNTKTWAKVHSQLCTEFLIYQFSTLCSGRCFWEGFHSACFKLHRLDPFFSWSFLNCCFKLWILCICIKYYLLPFILVVVPGTNKLSA